MVEEGGEARGWRRVMVVDLYTREVEPILTIVTLCV